jgi:hypothetical protein
MFVDPSPPAGLLIEAGVDLERLIRRCRALGVEIEAELGNLKATRQTPAPGTEGSHRTSSTANLRRSRTPPARTR